MDNYLQDFDGKSAAPKRRFGALRVLLLCLLCAVVGAAASLGVCGYLFANQPSPVPQPGEQVGGAYVDEPDGQTEQPPVGTQTQLSLLGPDYDDAAVSVGKTVSPSVVFISNIQNVRTFMRYGLSSATQEMVASTGSGVVYSAEGYIITNNHVVAGAEKLSVTLYNGDSYLAEVVGRDERTDLAVIKIEPKGELTAATFGDSDKLVVGETAIAIGNPGGEDFANSLTRGVISGLDRSVSTSDGTVLKVVQTDAAINPGNSGGALCNSRGEVVGINTVKISLTGYEGMGFAIPSNDVLEICQELMKSGKVQRPALGVGIVCDVTPQIAYYNDLAVDYGVVVEPTEGSGALAAGMEKYDVIIGLDGVEITSFSELQTEIFKHEIGDTVKVQVMRGEEKLELEVTLQELAD